MYVGAVLLAIMALAAASGGFSQNLSRDATLLWADGRSRGARKRREGHPDPHSLLPHPAKATRRRHRDMPGREAIPAWLRTRAATTRCGSMSSIAGIRLEVSVWDRAIPPPSMLQDVSRAMRTVRAKAAEWKIDPSGSGSWIVGRRASRIHHAHSFRTAATRIPTIRSNGKAFPSGPGNRSSTR